MNPKYEPFRIYYDAEFTELSRNGKLISIGLNTQLNDTFYAEFTDHGVNMNPDAPDNELGGCTRDQFNWLHTNVFDNLLLKNQTPNTTNLINGIRGEHSFVHGDSEYVNLQLTRWLHRQAVSLSPTRTVQFYTDCYAYDWMLLNDLLTNGGSALSAPDYVHYIPIDLATRLFYKGIDPDISREEYSRVSDKYHVDVIDCSGLFGITKTYTPLDKIPKHNSLWDAYIIKLCFERIDGYNG